MRWSDLGQAERNALYNNGAAVANSAAILAAWDEASEGWRKAHSDHLALAYADKARNTWDVFPGGDPRKPCLIHIHGGYWQMRSKDTFSCLAAGVAAHGWSVAFPGYTLAPENTIPGIIAELKTALDWFHSRRGTLGVQGPLILSGWSAGGHLAAMLLNHPSVLAGIAISGVYELGPLRDTYLNEKLRLTDSDIATASPLRLDPSPKHLAIAYGTGELPPLVRDSRALHAKRAAAHCPGSLVPVPGADHFSILEELRAPNGLLTKLALRIADDAA